MTLNENQSGGATSGVHSMIAEVGKARAQEIYMSHPSAWPLDVGDVPLGLTDCPSGFSTTASWRKWKDRLLSRSAAYPENPGLIKMIERVDEIVAWREGIPRHWRWWKED